MLRLRHAAVLASLLIGCADGTLPPVTSRADPSNPAAPETPFSRASSALGTAPPAPSAAPITDAVYVCPMHAQIVRDAPGTCPICGMTLAPHPREEVGQAHSSPGGAR